MLVALSCGDPDVIVVPNAQICPPNAVRCNGPVLELCSPDGLAVGTLNCPLGCENNECIAADCTPNLKACVDAKIAEHCDANGNSTLISCDFSCINGECVDVVCTPGIAFCDPGGDKVQLCSADGLSITEQEQCPYGCDLTTATCLAPACETGELRCGADGNPELCNEERTAFEPVPEVVCEETCENGQCIVSACTPGTKRCAVGRVEQCKQDGTGYAVFAECTYGCISDGQTEALCANCYPNAVACDGNDVVYCPNPLTGWVTDTTCDPLESCVQGVCAPVVSLEGPSTSDALRILISGAIADCWIAMSNSPENGPITVCRGIDTTGMAGDLKKSDLMSWFCNNQGKALTADDFSSSAHFEAAKTVYGCGLLDLQDLTMNTTSESIHAGLFQAECIAHQAEKKEIIIAPCSSFE